MKSVAPTLKIRHLSFIHSFLKTCSHSEQLALPVLLKIVKYIGVMSCKLGEKMLSLPVAQLIEVAESSSFCAAFIYLQRILSDHFFALAPQEKTTLAEAVKGFFDLHRQLMAELLAGLPQTKEHVMKIYQILPLESISRALTASLEDHSTQSAQLFQKQSSLSSVLSRSSIIKKYNTKFFEYVPFENFPETVMGKCMVKSSPNL